MNEDVAIRQALQAEKIAVVRQFAVGLGDELNNLLIVILGRLKIISEREKIDKDISDNLDVINSCVNGLRKIVDQIFKFSRNTPYKFENLAINEVIDGALILLDYHKSPPAGISIEKDLAGGLPLVRGDLKQLQEALLVLFLNAYQAMPEGGKLTIRTLNLQDQYIEIRVSDSGYESATSRSAKKEWLGLGLLNCYNIVNNLNGFIEIEKQGDCGTTFVIKLTL